MRIRINLKIFIFILIFLLTKQIKIYGILMLFALIHELGHIIVGVILGFKPTKLEIMPYGISVGFKIKCEDYNKKIKKGNMLAIKKVIIALAGPLTNLILTIIFLTVNINFFGIERNLVIYSNILIGAFNLLPIYPLDGSKILMAFLPYNAKRWFEEHTQLFYIIFLVIWITPISGMIISPTIEAITGGIDGIVSSLFGLF